ncbi:MAG: DNA replication/repair protein RecF [bacterium]
MLIQSLQIQNLRSIEQAELEPGSRINLISGNNGAGKTSVLEAIYLLGRGKSFRHSEAGPLIRSGAKTCQLIARLTDSQQNLHVLGMERAARKATVRFSGQEVKRRSELFKILPQQLVTPLSHALIEDSPGIRRRFIDHGLFHVEHGYHEVLFGYYRVLKQRNAALKQGNGRFANSFNPQLLEFGRAIHQARLEYIDSLVIKTREILSDIGGDFHIELVYQPGWDAGSQSFEEALASRINQDLSRGYSTVGPHRADVRILSNGVSAANHLSRGQQKLLVYTLKLSECSLQVSRTGHSPLFLVDDISAELDARNLGAILEKIIDFGLQTFITSVAPIDLPASCDARMFHVEHGCINTRE